jgi:hypothetical protein
MHAANLFLFLCLSANFKNAKVEYLTRYKLRGEDEGDEKKGDYFVNDLAKLFLAEDSMLETCAYKPGEFLEIYISNSQDQSRVYAEIKTKNSIKRYSTSNNFKRHNNDSYRVVEAKYLLDYRVLVQSDSIYGVAAGGKTSLAINTLELIS